MASRSGVTVRIGWFGAVAYDLDTMKPIGAVWLTQEDDGVHYKITQYGDRVDSAICTKDTTLREAMNELENAAREGRCIRHPKVSA